jgi:hypothetical protein
MRLIVSNDKRADLVGNAFGWKIMSERALATIKEFVPENEIQALTPPMFNIETEEPVGGYYLANCLRIIPALAYQNTSDLVYADRVVIRDSSVPPGTHMFRLAEAPRHWIISEQLWQRLAGLDGFDANATETVP